MNLIIGGIILWIASKIFPRTVQIADFKTLVIAIVLLSVVTVLVAVLCYVIAIISALAGNFGTTLISIIAVLFANVIAMYIISDYLVGFNIVGFWPKVILSICFSAFYISKQKQ